MLDTTTDGNDPDFVWRRDFVTREWEEALGYASTKLLNSRTSVRIPFLREDLFALVKHEGTYLPRWPSIMHQFTLCRSQPFPSSGCF